MRADVLQAIAICLYGNTYLVDPESDRAYELMGANSLFKSVFQMCFDRRTLGSRNVTIVGSSVAPWLRRMRSEDVPPLRLHLDEVAMPGGAADGNWGIVTDGNTGTELWEPIWKGRLVRYGEPPKWDVTYHGERINRWSIPHPLSVQEAHAKLAAFLAETVEVSLAHGFREIAGFSQRCLDLQEQRSTVCPGYPDLFPESLDIPSRQVLSAAVRVLVVFGSAAWGDALKKRDCPEFTEASQRLWRAALASFEAFTFSSVLERAS